MCSKGVNLIFFPLIVHGNWGEWLPWTACSVTCGNGTQNRSRRCDNPAPLHGGNVCIGDKTEEQSCSSGSACPGNVSRLMFTTV